MLIFAPPPSPTSLHHKHSLEQLWYNIDWVKKIIMYFQLKQQVIEGKKYATNLETNIFCLQEYCSQDSLCST